LIGIVHGDIKCENVLIFKRSDGFVAKVIDFGYSCFGTTESELVNVACTEPWEAPEHGDQFFQFSSARKMDIYSFGMLVCRTMLSKSLSTTVGKVGHFSTAEEIPAFLEYMKHLKSSTQFLDLVLQSLRESSTIEETWKADLEHIFRLCLQHNTSMRAPGFSLIMAVLFPHER